MQMNDRGRRVWQGLLILHTQGAFINSPQDFPEGLSFPQIKPLRCSDKKKKKKKD